MRGIERPHDAFANGRQPVVIKFELWNRQTYPIVLRKSHVVAAGFEPDDYCSIVDELIAPAAASHDEIIAPGRHGCYERKGTMPVFELAPACAVHFDYFDPISNRIKEISGRRERETLDTVMRDLICRFNSLVQLASCRIDFVSVSPAFIRLYKVRANKRLSECSHSFLASACGSSQQHLVRARQSRPGADGSVCVQCLCLGLVRPASRGRC